MAQKEQENSLEFKKAEEKFRETRRAQPRQQKENWTEEKREKLYDFIMKVERAIDEEAMNKLLESLKESDCLKETTEQYEDSSEEREMIHEFEEECEAIEYRKAGEIITADAADTIETKKKLRRLSKKMGLS